MNILACSLRSVAAVLIVGLSVAAVWTPAEEKPEIWTEIRSPNFIVTSSAGEKQARRVAEQFELFRAAFVELFPNARVELGKPLIILAVKNEKALRVLLPGFWEKKGQSRPAGIFVPGQEKLYVALRTDMEGEFPFQIIYHEYAHALMRLNFQDLPLWLSEGLAEIFAQSQFTGREITMGRPSTWHLARLQQSKLLPLDVLLSAGHDSAHYNEQDKTSIFYAQSWALAHYIALSKAGREGNLLMKYLNALARDPSPTEAAGVFGDRRTFEKTLRDYTRQDSYFGYKAKRPLEIDEKAFPRRQLAPAEAAALLGDFHVHMNRPNEARAALQEALRLDPNSALAHESMGLLHLHQNDFDGATKWFDRAADLDSGSYIAHFYSAMAAHSRLADDQVFATVESRLLKVLQLNPQFVPAYSLLSQVYLQRDDTLEKALEYARRAARLEPGTALHHLSVASVLMRMERYDEAIVIARSVLATATSDSDKARARSLLGVTQQIKEVRAAGGRVHIVSGERAGTDGAAGRSAEDRGRADEIPFEPPPEPAVQPRQLRLTGRQTVASGKVTEVVCGRKELALTLDAGGIAAKLYSGNFYAIDFRAPAQWTPPANFQPCEHLHGLRLKVNYRVAEDAEYLGEIVDIEILP